MPQSVYQRLGRIFAPERFDPSRRTALKIGAAAGAAAALSGCANLVKPLLPAAADRRVIVIGGGFSGLVCAHKLAGAGLHVQVLEARDRVGGRVFSFSDSTGCGGAYIAGRNVEGGGELIGTNHLTWVELAAHFGLTLIPMGEDEGTKDAALWNGKRIDFERAKSLWEQLDAAHETLNETARAVNADEPWRSPNAEALDATSLATWAAGLRTALNFDELATACIRMEFEANNGVVLERQSLLGNAASIKGGGVEKYWTDSETHRCAGGNQQLAVKLAQSLGDRLSLRTAVSAVEKTSRGFNVRTADGRVLECDEVVVAVPPSVWGRIRFEPGMPTRLEGGVQMGCNVKHLSRVKGRFWREGGGGGAEPLSQYGLVLGDQNRVCMTWDGTDGQDGEGEACLTSFMGAEAARRALADSRSERDAHVAAELEALFPGYGANLVQTRFMDWPREEWTGASYSFPAPGQLMAVGSLLRTGGTAWGANGLHFAGEHCDPAFVGYMEGALRSGARVADQIAAGKTVAMTV